MRVLLRGLLAGLLLSCLRAPLGLDLFQWPAVGARTAYGWRAAALAAAGVGLFVAAQGVLSAQFLAGAALGLALHGLLLANAWAPGTSLALAIVAGLGLLLVAAVRPSAPERASADASTPRFFGMLGLAAAGAGATIALEGIARHVRLFGGALEQDDAVFATVLAVLLAVGAAAFGWLAASKHLRGLSLPTGLAAGASVGFLSLHVVSYLSDPRGLGSYLKRFHLDTSQHGMLAFDALVAAACFIAPALVLGAALCGARGRSQVLSVFVGAALGLALIPGLLAVKPDALTSEAQASSAELIPLGAMVASAGALIAILSLSDRGGLARWLGIAATLVFASPALILETGPRLVLSPWAKRPTFPLIAFDTPEGLITVESFGLAEASWSFATLNRRSLTPEFEDASADAARLRASLELLPAELRARGTPRVLLVGQLSPARARALTEAGAGRVDRTAAWFESMPNIEQTLWKVAPQEPPPPGEVLSPSTANARLSGGEYDLVIAAAVPGDLPRATALSAAGTTGAGAAHASQASAEARGSAASDEQPSDGTTVVRWFEIENPAHQRNFGGRLALVLDGLERPALGVLTNASAGGKGPDAPLVLDEGSPRLAPFPLAWLRMRRSDRWNERADAARAAMFSRLAQAARGGPLENLTAGLEIFYSAQSLSSQFETPEDKTELPDACLDRFLAAALAGPPDPFLRNLWESLARTLTGKRWIEEIYGYVEPVAQAHRPWPALEKSLARADLESLEPEEAITRLQPLTATSEQDFEVWYLLGEAQCAARKGNEALESWGRAAQLPSTDRLARRKVALALVRSGEPRGREAAVRFLIEFPGDEELQQALQQPSGSARPPTDPCPP